MCGDAQWPIPLLSADANATEGAATGGIPVNAGGDVQGGFANSYSTRQREPWRHLRSRAITAGLEINAKQVEDEELPVTPRGAVVRSVPLASPADRLHHRS